MHERGDAGQLQLEPIWTSSLSIALSIEQPAAVPFRRFMLRVGALLRHFTSSRLPVLATMSAPSNGAADALQRVSSILGRGDGWEQCVGAAVERRLSRGKDLSRERDAVGRWAVCEPATVSDEL